MTVVPSQNGRTGLRQFLPKPDALQAIPEAMARKYNAIPLEISDGALRVAMANPEDIFAMEALATQSQMRIEPELATVDEIHEALDFNYKDYDEIEKQIASIPLSSEMTDNRAGVESVINTPLAQALALIINEAVKARASDIHFQPQEDGLRVRYRIDGALHDTMSLPIKTANSLISRIKVLSNMNIADHHRPQDGQFSIKAKGRVIDIRVGTVATVHGEMATLRLLDKSRGNLDLTDLGFLDDSLESGQI